MNFRFFSISSSNFAFFEFLMRILMLTIISYELPLMNFSGFRTKFQKRVTSVAFQSILRKRIRKLPKILKYVKNIHYYLVFIIIHSCPYSGGQATCLRDNAGRVGLRATSWTSKNLRRPAPARPRKSQKTPRIFQSFGLLSNVRRWNARTARSRRKL